MAIIDRLGATVSATDAPSSATPNAGLAIKTAVRCATTGPITLNGLQTIDGVSLNAGDRVLVKDQTNQTTNGIYNVSAGNWAAASDFQNNTQLAQGLLVSVFAGTLNGSSTWQLTTADPIALGTSALTFSAQAFVPNTAPPSGFGLYKASATLLGLSENGLNILPYATPTGIADPSTGIGGAGVDGQVGGLLARLNESWIHAGNYHFLLSKDDTIYPLQVSIRGTWLAGDVASFQLSWSSGAVVRTFSHTVTGGDTNHSIASALTAAAAADAVFVADQIYSQGAFNSSGANWDFQIVPHYAQYPISFSDKSTSAGGSIVQAVAASNLLADPVGVHVARSVAGRAPAAGDYIGEFSFHAQLPTSGPGTAAIARIIGYNDNPGVSGRIQFQTYSNNVNGTLNVMIARQGVYLQDANGNSPTDGTAGDKGYGWFNVPVAGGYDLSGAGTLTNNGAGQVQLTALGTNQINLVSSNGAGLISFSPNAATVAQVTTSGLQMVQPYIYPSADSTTAIRIGNHALSANIVTVDTTNKRVGVNKTPGAFDLDVNGQGHFGSQLQVDGNIFLQAGSVIYPTTDSTTALGIANAAGSRFVAFDSSNKRTTMTLNSGTPAPAFTAGTILALIGQDGAQDNILSLDQYGGAAANLNAVAFRSGRGTAASPTATQASDFLGGFRFNGYTGSAMYRTAALIVQANENFSGTAGGADLQWYTTPNTTQALALALTFKASGGLAIGTTNDPGLGGLYIKNATMINTATAFTNGAGAAAGTLTNAPAAGNPTKWIPVNDNGTTRFIPAW